MTTNIDKMVWCTGGLAGGSAHGLEARWRQGKLVPGFALRVVFVGDIGDLSRSKACSGGSFIRFSFLFAHLISSL